MPSVLDRLRSVLAPGRSADPFFRTALHPQRGEWHSVLGPGEADLAWLWYENLDAVGPPSSEARRLLRHGPR
jgi:hypothetical protein